MKNNNINSDSILQKRLRRFKSIKRGYYSLIILITLYSISLFGPLIISKEALIVCYADGNFNVLDIVALANCVLLQTCSGCAGDINADGNYNVLDIVALANCVLEQNCGE